MLNIYLLTQNTNRGYDTFDSCMVAAPDEATARGLHPRGDRVWNGHRWAWADGNPHNASDGGWTDPDNVTVEHVGVTLAERHFLVGVICSSFNAG